MPAAPRVTYPGVYVQEVPSDVKTIVPVDTATTAFIGRALRGPVNQPIVINNFGDFQRIFGELWNKSTMSFAVRDFFLHGGSKAVVVRLFAPSAEEKAGKAAAKALAKQIDGAADLSAAKQLVTTAETAAANKSDAEKDAVAQIKTVVDAGVASDFGKTRSDVNRLADDFPPPPYLTAKLTVDGPSGTPTPPAATSTTVAPGGSNAPPSGSTSVAPGGANAPPPPSLEFHAKWPGAWANHLEAEISFITDTDVRKGVAKKQGLASEADLFNLRVSDTLTEQVEVFENVSLVDGPRRLDKVLEASSELVVLATDLDGSTPPATPTEVTKFKVASQDQATDGDDLEAPLFLGNQSKKEGIYALADADIFNMLCIPPYNLDNDTDPNVLAEASAYCIARRAILLVDPPSSWKSKRDAVAGFPGLKGVIGGGTNAAIFFPRIREANPLRDNRIETVAPCGAVAGIFARTDAQRGVWKAPAGIEATFRGVDSLSVAMTDAENGELNPLGVNCLRTLPAAGHVIWGARTLDGDDRLASQWKYIPVRRTALMIEESLYRGSQWAVFEPNDEPLWSQLRLNIGSFMHGLFRQGAFQGSSPADAYFVKCDATTTTQADIDRGIVNVVIGFAPLKPAEFVVLYIQQIAGQLAT